jgi:glycosyltransferase involved in cell wall biosynthesis
MRRLANKLGISDRVEFLGYVADISSVYAKADLVIQSSFTEGLPNVILEAAYIGVPIVATNVGGTAEVIEHNVSGWLVEPKSRKELVAGIQCFLENPTHFYAMSRTARVRVRNEFSFDERTTAQINMYAELVDGSP